MSCCCGPHISLGTTLYNTICSLHGTKADALQVFYGNYISYNIRNFTSDDIQKSGDYLREHKKKIYVHAPYVINLASDKEDMVDKGKACLQNILKTQSRIDPNQTGTVLHIGAQGTIQNVVNRINDVDMSSPLYLEICAGEATKLGKNMDELRKLKEGIGSHRLGFCIDTCHCHSSCMCDMRDSKKIISMFEDLESFGSKNVMIHLNDSKTEFGSKKDRHSVVGFGSIWDYHKPESFESLITLRDYCKEKCFDIILETPSESPETFELNILKR
jgi:deoxyribonuclease-4